MVEKIKNENLVKTTKSAKKISNSMSSSAKNYFNINNWTFRLAILAGIFIFIALYVYISAIAAQPTPVNMYNYIVNNYATNLVNASSTGVIYYSIPTTSEFSLNNTTNVSVTFPQGKYIYFYGAEYCPYCAVESYVIYNYLNPNTPFPSYNSNWTVTELNIPMIPFNLIQANAGSNGYTLVWNEAPVNATVQEENQNNLGYLSGLMQNWYESIPLQQRVLFNTTSSTIPQVYVVDTNGSTTNICMAYADLPVFGQYNSSFTSLNENLSTANIKQLDLNGINSGAVIPLPSVINVEYNILQECGNTV